MPFDLLPIELVDTSNGAPGQIPRVNAAGDRLEYADQPSGGSAFTTTPEDHGAVGDGATDDTAALQAAIDAVAAAGGGTVAMKSGATYLCNGSFDTSRHGNAILTMPLVDGVAVRLLGGPPAYGGGGAAVIKTTVTGVTYTSGAVPCLLGGRADGTFIESNLVIENLHFTLPDNPTLAAVDAQYIARLEWIDSTISVSTVTTQPTHTWAFGLRTPTVMNFNSVLIRGGGSYGMYAGIVACPESLTVAYWSSKWCVIGMGVVTGGHMGAMSKVSLEWCTYMVSGWTATAGAAGVSVTNPFAPYAMFTIAALAIEDAASGNWYSTTEHIHDPTNLMRGVVFYDRLTASGPTHALTLNGATGLSLFDTGQANPLPSGSTYALTVKDEGSNVDTATTSLDFTGAGVAATTDGAGHVTVTIPGGGGTSGGELLVADGITPPLTFADLITNDAQTDLLYQD